MSDKEMEYPTVEELVAGVEEDRAAVSEALSGDKFVLGNEMKSTYGRVLAADLTLGSPGKYVPIPEVWQTTIPRIQIISPTEFTHPESNRTPEFRELCDGVFNYFFHKHPEMEGIVPMVSLYEGYKGERHVRYVRYDIAEGASYTYVTMEENYKTFLEQAAHHRFDEIINVFRNQLLWRYQYGDGLHEFLSPIELPLHWLGSSGKHEDDDILQEDLLQLDRVAKQFNKEFDDKIAHATKLADGLKDLIPRKDHDLYLTFKGVNDFSAINIGLDRVFPELPESGEVILGDNAVNLDDWQTFPDPVKLVVRRLTVMNKQMNRMMDKYQNRLRNHKVILDLWRQVVKTRLLASSHFMKAIYIFSAKFGMDWIESTANDILQELHGKGGNIGLDLNEWVVYSYEAPGLPVPLKEEALDFQTKLYKRYTQSFIDALYAFLLGIQSPYIRPYNHREVVDGNDGIPMGSIRQA